MLPFENYLYDEHGNRVIISISKFGSETSGSGTYGPVDRTVRDMRENHLERQRRTLREFRPQRPIDPTAMVIGEEPPMVNFPDDETVTIRVDNQVDNALSFYVPRDSIQ